MTGIKNKIIEHYLKEFRTKCTTNESVNGFIVRDGGVSEISDLLIEKWLTSILNEILLDENELVDYFAIYDAKNGTTTLNPDDFWAYSEKEQQDLAWTLAKAITAKQIPNKLTNKNKQTQTVES